MDKLTQPQQLSFQFEFYPQEKVIPPQTPSSPVVIDFGNAFLKREKAKVNYLYEQILDSVRHIG